MHRSRLPGSDCIGAEHQAYGPGPRLRAHSLGLNFSALILPNRRLCCTVAFNSAFINYFLQLISTIDSSSDHPGPQPMPEISHRDCSGVNCCRTGMQKSWQRGAQKLGRGLESSVDMKSSGSLFGIVCTERAGQLRPALPFVAHFGSLD